MCPEPLRPDVPARLAAWQTPAQLVTALAATGLAEMQRYRGSQSTWLPLAETLATSMQQTTSWPHGRPTPEWRVFSIVVHGEPPRAHVWLTLEGRDEQGDTVALNIIARRRV